MLINKKIVSAVVVLGLTVQSAYPCFAFSNKSHILNRTVETNKAKNYNDMTDKLSDMIGEYDDADDYVGEIKLEIGNSQMIVDGEARDIDAQGTAATIIDERTMIPAAKLAETLGCSVAWNGEERTVEVSGQDTEMRIPIGKDHIDLNGESIEIPTAAVVSDEGRTLVPAKALSEGLGCEVAWDDETQTVTITRDFQTKRLIVKTTGKVDFDEYNAIEVLHAPNDDFILVQFATIYDAKAAFEKLQKKSSVTYVEPDVVFMNAELSGSDGSELTESWEMDYTNILSYANSVSSSRKMKIAVIDSGVKPVGILRGKVEGGKSMGIVSGDAQNDSDGHGTGVASIVAKCMGNVDYSIYPVKITNTRDLKPVPLSVFSDSIAHSVGAGADIINMSLSVYVGRDYKSNTMNEAVKKAVDNGVVIVDAAGNNWTNVVDTDLIASRNDVVVVGASDAAGKKYERSSCGATVDLFAPGVNIAMVGVDGKTTYETGTSFAAPQVAAAAALIKARNPSWSVSQIEAEIKRNVYVPDVWNFEEFGTGILCFGTPNQPKKEEVRITAGDVTVKVGTTAPIFVNDGNGNAVNAAECTFTSNNNGIAKVSADGTVTGVAEGTADVTVKYKEAQTEVTVTVTKDPVKKEVIGYRWGDENGNKIENTIEMKKGETRKISLYELYNDGSEADITEKYMLNSFEESVATVSGNKITALSAGKTNISMGNAALSSVASPRPLVVKVTEPQNQPEPPENKPTSPTHTGYEWSTDTATKLEMGETTNIKLYAVYSDGSRKDVTKNANLYSTDTDVVEINSSGRIKAVGEGTAKIMQGTAALAGVSTAQPFSITVKAPAIELDGFEWSKTDFDNLEVGDSVNIKLYAKYSDGSKNDVTQSSDLYSTDEDVITIRNGKITAVGSGTAKIMQGAAALAGIGSARPITITVNEPPREEVVDFEYEDIGNGVEITAYTGSERYVTIPDKIGGAKVVSIGSKAFYGNRNISSVSMPNSIETVSDYAFAKCKSLKSVHFSGAITEIGAHAFDDCTSLTGVQLPSNLSEIASYTFRGCSALKRIKIPSSVYSIGDNAFANCRSLDITIPASVEDIASSAFTKGNSIRISGESGSVAESYAQEKGFSFN